MIKLSAKRLIETAPETIGDELKILFAPTSNSYYLICNTEVYELAIDGNYLVWEIPIEVDKGNFSIKVQVVDPDTDIVLYTTNTLYFGGTSGTGGDVGSGYDFDADYPIRSIRDEHKTIQVTNRRIAMPVGSEMVVSRDSISQLLTFEISRFFDKVDLSNKTCTIKYINPKRESGRALPVNVRKTDSKLYIGWLLDDHVAAAKGVTRFSIEFLGYETFEGDEQLYVWQTLPAELTIHEGIWIDDTVVTERYPTIIEDILIKLKELESAGSGGIGGSGEVPPELVDLVDKAIVTATVENGNELVFKNSYGDEIFRIDLPEGGASPYANLYFDDASNFPPVGKEGIIYYVTTEGEEGIYRWDDGDSDYHLVANNYYNIGIISGGGAGG